MRPTETRKGESLEGKGGVEGGEKVEFEEMEVEKN